MIDQQQNFSARTATFAHLLYANMYNTMASRVIPPCAHGLCPTSPLFPTDNKYHSFLIITPSSPPPNFVHYFESEVGRELLLKYSINSVSLNYTPPQRCGLAKEVHNGFAVAIPKSSNIITYQVITSRFPELAIEEWQRDNVHHQWQQETT